eukprot:1230606-Pleurochrysis_carterae.AAC.1
MRLPGAPAPGDCPLHPTAASHCLRPFSTTSTLARLTAVRGGCGRRSLYCRSHPTVSPGACPFIFRSPIRWLTAVHLQ